MNINVNGIAAVITEQEMSYAAVLTLAGLDPKRTYSVTYKTRRSGDEQRRGILTPDKSIVAEEGMSFSACETGNG